MAGTRAHISRSAASRGRLLAQAGFVVVIAITAFAGWKWSGPPKDAELIPLVPLNTDAGAPGGRPRPGPSLTADVDSISGSLLAVSNAYRPPASGGDDTRAVEPVPTPNGNADDPVRYLGLIEEGERRLGLLVVDGRQRVVVEGGAFGDGGTLVAATADGATIEDRSGRRRIALAGRQGPLVAKGVLPQVTATSPGVPGVVGRAGQMSETEMRRSAAAERMRANREDFERRRQAALQSGASMDESGVEGDER